MGGLAVPVDRLKMSSHIHRGPFLRDGCNVGTFPIYAGWCLPSYAVGALRHLYPSAACYSVFKVLAGEANVMRW